MSEQGIRNAPMAEFCGLKVVFRAPMAGKIASKGEEIRLIAAGAPVTYHFKKPFSCFPITQAKVQIYNIQPQKASISKTDAFNLEF